MTASVPGALVSALADRYRIERELGAGGMATVYLAEDVRHRRKVALKVLHPELSAVLGPERFLKEIELTASLQHPHILPLFDSGSAEGQLFYVMPFVEGETLRARLERETQLPVGDALRLTREVADALQYAHERGVIHRDIKPENILIAGTAPAKAGGGHAVVADFGIALAVQQAGGQRMTQTGLSLGTPQYMAPEQALGEKSVDARADVYALGAVCYEMLVGEPPFTGPTAQAIVAKLLTTPPPSVTAARGTVPAHVDTAIAQALAKLPADRPPSAREFAAMLEGQAARYEARSARSAAIEARGAPPNEHDRIDGDSDHHHSNAAGAVPAYLAGSPALPGSRPAPRTAHLAVPWLVALLLATAAAWGWLRGVAPPERVMRLALAFSAGQELEPEFYGFSFDLSPDGRRLAYVGPGARRGASRVWVRPLDALTATPLAGTEGAVSVRWSPDSRAVLVVRSSLSSRLVTVDDGQVVSLANVVDGAWRADGAIYWTGTGQGILRRSPAGRIDTLFRGDTAYRFAHPAPLAGDDIALVVRTPSPGDLATRSEIVAVSFRTKRQTVVGPGVYARLLSPRSLLYASAEGNVFVADFDPSALRMTGTPVPVARVAIGSNSGRSYPQISVSDEGTMMYLAGDLLRQRVVWLDAGGRLARRLPIEGDLWGIALSPDATRLAFTLRTDARDPRAAPRGTGDVWVEELVTGARTRLTDQWFNVRPSWSPDGRSVLYARVGGPLQEALLERRADASEPERLVLSQAALGHSVGNGRWLPDHQALVVSTYQDLGGPSNIYSTTAGGGGTRPLATTPATEVAPTPSPDGTLVAYVSDETGVPELYVQRFPAGGERLAVSRGASSPPRWSRDGRSLYYWNERGALVVASIASRPALAVTATREIPTEVTLGGVGPGRSNVMFDVAADGRIIVAEDVRGTLDLVLVRNWRAALGQTGRQ